MKENHNITTTFDNILSLIKVARERIVKTVNTEIIDLYWQIGKEVSGKTSNGGWGKSVVEELANYIASHFGGMRGFSAQNIWRMRQFYETYSGKPILSTLVRELSWSNNLLIMSRAKNDDEKLFYLRLAIEEKYSYRELDRQITAMRYERFHLKRKLPFWKRQTKRWQDNKKQKPGCIIDLKKLRRRFGVGTAVC
jgi:predicted nuclease of restriction endonuclease-like (RecB) superfamily